MDFGATRTGRWLAAHAVDFGFVVSYPNGTSDATCYDAEPWHVRWIGRDQAAAVQASGLTLREWLWRTWAGEAPGRPTKMERMDRPHSL